MKRGSNNMKILLQVIMLVSCLGGAMVNARAGGARLYALTSSQWNVPRTTRSVLKMPALRKTIKAYDKHAGSRIQVHYPGGDEGTLWASELRSWLVSLGVASSQIELLPGSRKPGQIELQVVIPPGGGQARE